MRGTHDVESETRAPHLCQRRKRNCCCHKVFIQSWSSRNSLLERSCSWYCAAIFPPGVGWGSVRPIHVAQPSLPQGDLPSPRSILYIFYLCNRPAKHSEKMMSDSQARVHSVDLSALCQNRTSKGMWVPPPSFWGDPLHQDFIVVWRATL